MQGVHNCLEYIFIWINRPDYYDFLHIVITSIFHSGSDYSLGLLKFCGSSFELLETTIADSMLHPTSILLCLLWIDTSIYQ